MLFAVLVHPPAACGFAHMYSVGLIASAFNTVTWFWLYRTIFRKSLDYFGIYAKIDGMKRYLEKFIQEDLDKKIVLLTGPRQAGKTTLSKMLTSDYDYFNFDNLDDRLRLPMRYRRQST